jgi:hypothetical protein
VPTYYPILFWIGFGAMGVGLVQGRMQRRSSPGSKTGP